ncbi:hypothetical protein MKEN_00816000 [Mycena kentingensis (nom. inval.)]|nr:hypothetical protein MKEN_00816000 [Mycena kentingensis (nom. inval.)]
MRTIKTPSLSLFRASIVSAAYKNRACFDHYPVSHLRPHSLYLPRKPDASFFYAMISGLSKAITLYLAPLITLTAILLSLFAYLAPTLLLQDRVALLTVSPTSQNSTKSIDGPTVFLGPLGSCARTNNDAPINCTPPVLNPVYDLSVLPSNAPKLLLSAPSQATPVFLGIAISFSIIFFVTFTLISFRHKMGEKLAATFEKPMFQRISAWLGVFGFFLGMTSFLILRMWFGKGADDFNKSLAMASPKNPQFTASIGNAFTMVWIAYAFYAVPVVISLAKLNVKASK